MTITKRLEGELFPNLSKNLRIAKINQRAEVFIRKKLLASLYMAAGMSVLTFMLVSKSGSSLGWVLLSFLAWFAIIFYVMIKSVNTAINKRRKSIDKDVLFAGRFLLVKLSAGNSLIKSIDDASKSFGVANSYFQEIMKDIDLGTPLETALDKATKTCPSERMKNILFQITNAMNIGIDVTKIVESALDDIAQQQLLEIEAYGKKLSSVALFYMLFAVVLPSLGLALLIIITSLVSINLDSSTFVVIAFFLILIEIFFITIFKQIRPNIHI